MPESMQARIDDTPEPIRTPPKRKRTRRGPKDMLLEYIGKMDPDSLDEFATSFASSKPRSARIVLEVLATHLSKND